MLIQKKVIMKTKKCNGAKCVRSDQLRSLCLASCSNFCEDKRD